MQILGLSFEFMEVKITFLRPFSEDLRSKTPTRSDWLRFPAKNGKIRVVNSSSSMNCVRSRIAGAVSRTPSSYLCLRCYGTKPDTDSTTHFGFRTIPSEKKEQMGKFNC